MNEQKEREAFENRMLKFGWRTFAGHMAGVPQCWYYDNTDLQARWLGWKARASLGEQQAPAEIAAGGFTISPFGDSGVWIARLSGEGMRVSPDLFERLIGDFYNKHF